MYHGLEDGVADVVDQHGGVGLAGGVGVEALLLLDFLVLFVFRQGLEEIGIAFPGFVAGLQFFIGEHHGLDEHGVHGLIRGNLLVDGEDEHLLDQIVDLLFGLGGLLFGDDLSLHQFLLILADGVEILPDVQFLLGAVAGGVGG